MSTVLVCVPYHESTSHLVEKAVRSILAQTHRDLVCVVVGDGAEPPLAGVKDSRLVVYTNRVNRGAYFSQMVALGASPFEWYAPIASDDWVDPEHIEKLAQRYLGRPYPWFGGRDQQRLLLTIGVDKINAMG